MADKRKKKGIPTIRFANVGMTKIICFNDVLRHVSCCAPMYRIRNGNFRA